MNPLQPSLAGDGIAVRPLTEVDREVLFAVASDPAIWALHPAGDRWQRPVFDRFFDDSLASGGGMAVLDAADGAMIGHSRYDPGRAEAGEVEIGWTFLARDRWGGRANATMKRLMVGHALRHFDRVIFLIGEDNVRSRRAMEKIGGRLTTRTLDTEMAGRTVRHVVYAIDQAGFADGPLGRRADGR